MKGVLLYQSDRLRDLVNPFTVLAQLWRQRTLIAQFTKRQLEVRHRGSFLGWLWPVLNPLLLFGVYGFVFMFVFDGRYGVRPGETRADYAVGVFLSLALMQIYIEVLNHSSVLIVANPNYVKKVVFPLEVLPVAVVAAAVVQGVIGIVLAGVAALILEVPIAATAAWLTVLGLPLLGLCLGTSWALAALGVFFRDLQHLIQTLALLLMFFSAVFYPAARIPDAFNWVKLNPFLQIMEAARAAVFGGRGPQGHTLLWLFLLSAAVMVLGYAFFKRARLSFPDLI